MFSNNRALYCHTVVKQFNIVSFQKYILLRCRDFKLKKFQNKCNHNALVSPWKEEKGSGGGEKRQMGDGWIVGKGKGVGK